MTGRPYLGWLSAPLHGGGRQGADLHGRQRRNLRGAEAGHHSVAVNPLTPAPDRAAIWLALERGQLRGIQRADARRRQPRNLGCGQLRQLRRAQARDVIGGQRVDLGRGQSSELARPTAPPAGSAFSAATVVVVSAADLAGTGRTRELLEVEVGEIAGRQTVPTAAGERAAIWPVDNAPTWASEQGRDLGGIQAFNLERGQAGDLGEGQPGKAIVAQSGDLGRRTPQRLLI